MNYTEEQQKDISERVIKANENFAGLQLSPRIQMLPVEEKDGQIVNALFVTLEDTKYLPEQKTEVTEEPVVAEKVNE
jgi:hypothetical protein